MITGKPLKTANIPQNNVSCVVIGERYASLHQPLKSLGIDVLSAPESKNLPKSVSSHGDMLFCDLGSGECVVENTESAFSYNLRDLGFSVYPLSRKLKSDYPNDVLLNAVISDKFIIASKHTESLILKKSEKVGKSVITVGQGYTKCSVCMVNSNALITADEGIGKKCKENNIDVLKIQPGFIDLPGYDYGFIGGCCGLLSPDTLAFTGDIKTHPDSENIISFCKNYGINTINLTVKGKKLLDIGSILPLLEI